MSSANRQTMYYQGRGQHSQQRLGLGMPIASSHLGSPHRDHQIVVVSGNSCNTGCVADYQHCECPSCESKNVLSMGHETFGEHEHRLYSSSYPLEQGHVEDDDDDGIVHEFTTETGERHVVIMTKTDEQEGGISAQERLRRQKLSEAARNRYALLSEEEKRAVTERRVVMRQRRKQKEREMEELEAILRASNDITDDLIPLDEAVIQRKRAKSSRYQTMSMDERREYNQKRRLRQLGLPENVNELEPSKLDAIKKHIDDVNSRKAEAARQRYHRMSHEERKAYNRRRTESFRKRRMEEEKLLSTPAGQITPEALEKAQNIMLRNAKRAEQARLRYQKKQQEKGVVMMRRQRKPKPEPQPSSGEPNLDRILDTIERDVVKKTVEARQALMRMRQTELKKEENLHEEGQFAPQTNDGHQILHGNSGGVGISHAAGPGIVQYVQIPAQSQNGLILTEAKFAPSSSSQSQTYTLESSPQKFERIGGVSSSNYYPISVVQHDWPQRSSSSSHYQLRPARIEVVQPTSVSSEQGDFDHQYTIHLDQHQQMSHRPMTSRNLDASFSPVDEKLLLQKAKRAERARRRYHEMSAEARHEFNAKRAHALKMARMRDEELCRLGDELSLKGEEPDRNVLLAIEQARNRRAKRAETARVKYQMTSEQRKAHNAMRDAQRRQRKRELEDTVVNQ